MFTKRELEELSDDITESPIRRLINLVAGEIFKLNQRVNKLEKTLGNTEEPREKNKTKNLF